MTGEELCNIPEISYKNIINKRKEDMENNINYFIEELLSIDDIRRKIKEQLDKK